MMYYLEIRDPVDNSCVVESLSSEQPFMAFNVGDIINGQSCSMSEGVLPHLIITKIEHFIFTVEKNNSIHHKVMLYTKYRN